MNVIADIIASIFELFWNNTIFDIPLLVWILLPTLISVALSLVFRKKETE